jgi:hypothetical protein
MLGIVESRLTLRPLAQDRWIEGARRKAQAGLRSCNQSGEKGERALRDGPGRKKVQDEEEINAAQQIEVERSHDRNGARALEAC